MCERECELLSFQLVGDVETLWKSVRKEALSSGRDRIRWPLSSPGTVRRLLLCRAGLLTSCPASGLLNHDGQHQA